MPNWNSIVMPVATPIAKLMPNRTPQNFVIRRQIVPAGHDVDAFHDGEQNRQTQRQRHEQEMVHGRQAELQPRKLHDIQRGRHGMLLGSGMAWIRADQPRLHARRVDRRTLLGSEDEKGGADDDRQLDGDGERISRARGCLNIRHR